MQNRELILCVPGRWAGAIDFQRVASAQPPAGRYMFDGAELADVHDNDRLRVDISEQDNRLAEAFRIAGRGRLKPELLRDISSHKSIAYLHFLLDLPGERDRMVKYCEILRNAGGLAVKLESSGLAHSWDEWFRALAGTPFDHYRCTVVLVSDERSYYSCGMHHFGLAECMVSRTMEIRAASDLIDRFNYWRILEKPELATGHTFSVDQHGCHFRLTHMPDTRHERADLFHNPHGIWALQSA